MNCKFIFKNFNTLHCAKRLCSLLVCLIILCTISPFQAFAAVSFKTSSSCPHKKFIYEYGVFLNVSEDNISRVKNYHTVVIDAEYFSRSTIKKLKKSGHVVYTYLNIGSLEDFRKDYNKYKKYCIGKYENWDGEQWVDVSQAEWQKRIKDLAHSYYKKGVDGFFIDNCDVYYYMGLNLEGSESQKVSSQKLFQGLKTILKNLRTRYNKPVIINGGDTFVSHCIKNNCNLKKYFTAVNQECVYTTIDFDANKLKRANSDDTKYFESYLRKVKGKGIRVYVLEYSKSKTIAETVRKNCRRNGFTYYISRSIDLT